MTAVGAARPSWARTAATSLVVGLATSGTLFAGTVALAPTASADDSSAVTVTAQQQDAYYSDAPFQDLSVTVSQTRNLTNQGITLTYSGGRESQRPNQQVAGVDFLQIVQCWGDLRDAAGDLVLDKNGQPQPDRTTCQYGASGAPDQTREAWFPASATIPAEDLPYTARPTSPFEQTQVAIPFKSVTGKVIASVVDGVKVPDVALSSNEFFNQGTTNEVSWAGFNAGGTGTATFEVQTNGQAPGLGCGNSVEDSAGNVIGQPCWLVVIPRLGGKSALFWDTWKHRLAVRLEFKPLGVRCALGAAERSTAGSELLALAVSSWQPVLCGQSGGSIFNLLVTSESDALQAASTGAPTMALTSRALGADDGTGNLEYAPVAVTGLTVAFAVDHSADAVAIANGDAPEEVQELDQQPFASMNLTPRLLAKLLTSSYTQDLPTYAGNAHIADNPRNLTADPEFLEYNPDWAFQSLYSPGLADALVPLGRSDSAWAVWSYILGDAEARAFLAGEPDPWGMVVNPWASTTDDLNPVGTAVSLPRDDFPKFDPAEVDPIGDEYGRSVINVVTWRPYAPDLDTAAYWVLRGDARVLGSWNTSSTTAKYDLGARDLVGYRKVLALTGTAMAARYQVLTAALRNPSGEFVAPTADSMTAAAEAMTADPDHPQVLRFDPASAEARGATNAYPLTVPVYAAASLGADASVRAANSSFIRYAADAGQTPGPDLGQLPEGYAPLPAAWRARALDVANALTATTATATPTASAPVPVPSATLPDTDLPSSLPPDGNLPSTGTPPTDSMAPASTPTPTPTATPSGVVVGAATPTDAATGALSAAVPISAAGGLLAAAAVPLVGRPRSRRPL